jgi:hypothetical protein
MTVYSQWICRIQKTGGQISHLMQWYSENSYSIVSYVMCCKLGAAVVCILRARRENRDRGGIQRICILRVM